MISKPENVYELLALIITVFTFLLVLLSYPGIFIFYIAKDTLQQELNLISRIAEQLPYTIVLLVGVTLLITSIFLEKHEKFSLLKLSKAACYLAFAIYFFWFTYR